MLNSFQLVLLCISLAVPIGPINAEIIRRGIKYGVVPAIFVSLGIFLFLLLF